MKLFRLAGKLVYFLKNRKYSDSSSGEGGNPNRTLYIVMGLLLILIVSSIVWYGSSNKQPSAEELSAKAKAKNDSTLSFQEKENSRLKNDSIGLYVSQSETKTEEQPIDSTAFDNTYIDRSTIFNDTINSAHIIVSNEKPTKSEAKAFFDLVNASSTKTTLISKDNNDWIYSIKDNSQRLIGYSIYKKSGGDIDCLTVLDTMGRIFTRHGYEYDGDGGVTILHYNYTGFISSMQVGKNGKSSYSANFSNAVTKEKALEEYNKRNEPVYSTKEITGDYASDGDKCSTCGLGKYVHGFCNMCGGASAERSYQSSSTAPCEMCGGSRFIETGGIHSYKKLCPSCRGTGKQTF
jgi:hypothetical protein